MLDTMDTRTPSYLLRTCMVSTRSDSSSNMTASNANLSLATVFKADPLDPARGKQYRDKILRWGGSREELDSLKVFATPIFSPNLIQR